METTENNCLFLRRSLQNDLLDQLLHLNGYTSGRGSKNRVSILKLKPKYLSNSLKIIYFLSIDQEFQLALSFFNLIHWIVGFHNLLTTSVTPILNDDGDAMKAAVEFVTTFRKVARIRQGPSPEHQWILPNVASHHIIKEITGFRKGFEKVKVLETPGFLI